MATDQQQLYLLIDELLWKEWDPIGINDQESTRDEYQSYTASVFQLKINNADIVTLAGYLYKIETTDIGLSGNKQHCEEIAQKIINL